MINVLPSILAADPLQMGDDIARMIRAGATGVHVDIMDAHFVPNLSFGPALCRAIRARFPGLWQDVHLMMDNPEDYLAAFAQAGADALTIHLEPLRDPAGTLERIRALGVRTGLALKPATTAESAYPLLHLCDQVLVMTVEPGFGGQKWMEDMMPKIRQLRDRGFRGTVAVDGGVNAQTAVHCVRAGADTLVMGTALLRSEDPRALLTQCAGMGENHGQ